MTLSFDLRQFRHALGAFITGVTVVTTTDPETQVPVGFTANSFTSLSLDPPLVLVCLGTRANLYKVFERAQGFAVNILAADQREISHRFASPVEDRFAGLDWRLSPQKNPLIAGVSAWFDCLFERRFIAGDHMVMIGEVKDFAASDRSGLGYARGNYFNDSLDKVALDAVSSQKEIKAGAVVEHQGQLLLMKKGDRLELPCSGRAPKAALAMDALMTTLAELGVDGDLGMLYAVHEDEQKHFSSMYFHVNCMQPPNVLSKDAVMIPMQDIPLLRLNLFEQGVIERYILEHAHGRYSIYFGSENSGKVTMRNMQKKDDRSS